MKQHARVSNAASCASPFASEEWLYLAEFIKMPLAADCETSKKPFMFPYQPEAFMVEFGVMETDGSHYSWLYNHPEASQSFRQNNKEMQEHLDATDLMICHNAKFELLWMRKLGLTPPPKLWCTQVAQYILEGQKKGPKGYYGLDQACERMGVPGKTDLVKKYWDSGYETDEIPANILIPYNQQDNVAGGSLYAAQVRDLITKPNLRTIMQLEMQKVYLLAEIEWNGMLVHMDTLLRLNAEYTQKVADYNAELEDIAGVRINWQSRQQVSALLFGGEWTVDDKELYEFWYKGHDDFFSWKERKCDRIIKLSGMGFEPPDGSETKVIGVYSTSGDILKSLKSTNKKQKRFLEILGLRGKAEKLRGTYFEGFQTKIINGYIHSSMNQTRARNGRLSSSNPNGQNMPRGSTGPVKSIFISRYD